MDRIIVEDKLGTYEAFIDSEDRDLVAGWVWRPLRTPTGVIYAQASRRRLFVYMHRIIAGAGAKEQVDHANHNGLDNRKANLRIATISENQANKPKQMLRKHKRATSQYKGVHWDKRRDKWAAYIAAGVPGQEKQRSLGRFDDEVEAARAYDRAAVERWGEFAILNFENFEREDKTA